MAAVLSKVFKERLSMFLAFLRRYGMKCGYRERSVTQRGSTQGIPALRQVFGQPLLRMEYRERSFGVIVETALLKNAGEKIANVLHTVCVRILGERTQEREDVSGVLLPGKPSWGNSRGMGRMEESLLQCLNRRFNEQRPFCGHYLGECAGTRSNNRTAACLRLCRGQTESFQE